MESSLKISAFEQVSLLTDFYQNTWFFATNIQAEQHASGSVASEITLDLLETMGIWS